MSAMVFPRHGTTSRIARLFLVVSIVAIAVVQIPGVTAPVAALDPASDSDLHVSMGIYYRLWGIGSASEDHFENAWEKTGGDPEIAIVAAVAAYRDGDYRATLGWLSRVPDSFEQRAAALCLEGAVYLRQATTAFTGASSLRPETYYSAAEQRFTEALALQSDLAFAKYMLARIHAARGESLKATILLNEIPEAGRIDAVYEMLKLLNQR